MKIRQEIFDTYWRFAAERQEIFFKRLSNSDFPYTSDPILNLYKFCNAYRASDRVSQFLIKDIIYAGKKDEADTLFRIFLFRLLNKIETWQEMEVKLGEISLKSFSFGRYAKILAQMKDVSPIYGNAFILCANKVFGFENKHENHLALLEKIFVKDKLANKLVGSKSLEELFFSLRKLPLIGNFMAYQIAIDFNYSEVFKFNENDFTIAGPGAIRGINKCFVNISPYSYSEIIMFMVENQDKEFKRLGLHFRNLWGRSLHAIDCQGLFCETDKYSRVKFPELKSNRVRIKAKYKQKSKAISYFYPPKWRLKVIE